MQTSIEVESDDGTWTFPIGQDENGTPITAWPANEVRIYVKECIEGKIEVSATLCGEGRLRDMAFSIFNHK